MSYPRFQRARDFKFAARTAGDLTLNSTAWANVDTALDLVLAAQVGDTVECGLSAYFSGTESVSGTLDFWTAVGGTPVNAVGSNGTTSDYATPWIFPFASRAIMSGSMMRTLVSGDISSGAVTLRLRYRTDTAANKLLRASTTIPLKVWVKNLGPADPN